VSFRVVNPGDKDWTSGRFLLWFGAYGDTKLLVWANSLEDALDAAVDWLETNAPGMLLGGVELEELHAAAVADGNGADQAWEVATADLTCAGNGGRYLPSWEWGLVSENPTRGELLAYGPASL
jgi:hypothetical protein